MILQFKSLKAAN